MTDADETKEQNMTTKDTRIMAKIGTGFELVTPEFNANFLAEFKDAIPWNERYWVSSKRIWYVAARHLETAATLCQELWPDLANALRTHDAYAHCRDAVTAETEALEASHSADSDINLDSFVPDGLEPYPFQRAGVQWAVTHPQCLIADEMGLGKTIQAAVAANVIMPTKTIIVCPASLKENWRREWLRWTTLTNTPVHVVHGKSKLVAPGACSKKYDVPHPALASRGIWIVNYDILARLFGYTDKSLFKAPLSDVNFDLLIVDEVHYCKSTKAQRTKALFGWWSKSARATLGGVCAERTILLTGTPLVNRPVELWPIVNAIDPTGLGKGFKSFTSRYCAGHNESVWTGKARGYVNVWKCDGATNLDELQRELRLSVMIRREKGAVLTELPPRTISPVALDTNGASKAVNAEMKAAATRLGVHTNEGVATALSRMSDGERKVFFETLSDNRREVAEAKLEAAADYIINIARTEKVVVFVHHQAISDALAAKLDAEELRWVRLDGRTPANKRQDVVDSFQNDTDVRVFIGQWTAAGVGITLTEAQQVVALELPWTPGDFTQGIDRCHRIGQSGNVQAHVLYLEGSLDEYMANLLVSKAATLHAVLDAPKEVAVVTPVSAATRRPVPTVNITSEQVKAVHDGLRALAGVCDGAVTRDGEGFNGVDSEFGRSLAQRETLTPRQAIAARKMLRKYVRQLGTELVELMGK